MNAQRPMTPSLFSHDRRGGIGPAMATLALLLAAQATAASAAEASFSAWMPSSVFVQAGFAEHTSAVAGGASWDWAWRVERAWGLFTGYLEVSLGRWSTDAPEGVSSSAWVTQFGITPVVRLQPRAWSPGWFVEGGIGANVVKPLYRNGEKHFSTSFNFGDHIGVGRQFGARHEHEWTLRLQHFSNAGIEHPNPGENFLQVRYLHRF